MSTDNLSFVPGKNIDSPFYKNKIGGFFLAVSFFLFLISAIACGGVIIYRNSLKKGNDALTVSVQKAQASFEPALINELIQMSDKLDVSKDVLNKHIALTPILDLLSKDTLTEVRFRSFSYGVSKENKIDIVLNGEAKSYSVLASQAEEFNKDKRIKGSSFSGLSLGDKGMINFTARLVLDSGSFIYKAQ